jgi:hypothetical protein
MGNETMMKAGTESAHYNAPVAELLNYLRGDVKRNR